jgi:ribonuclease HII
MTRLCQHCQNLFETKQPHQKICPTCRITPYLCACNCKQTRLPSISSGQCTFPKFIFGHTIPTGITIYCNKCKKPRYVPTWMQTQRKKHGNQKYDQTTFICQECINSTTLEISCETCEKPVKVTQEIKQAKEHHYCSLECYWNRSGNYGKNTRSYYPYEFKMIREWILERDGYQCFNCKTEEDLAVHHITGDTSVNDPFSLMTLCVACNASESHAHEGWMAWCYDSLGNIHGNHHGDGFSNFIIAGTDECGVGSWMGNLVACCFASKGPLISKGFDINDSKAISKKSREKIVNFITKWEQKEPNVIHTFGIVTAAEINKLQNIQEASKLAMCRAVTQIVDYFKQPIDVLYIDWYNLPTLNTNMVKKQIWSKQGDSKFRHVMIASNLGKVFRDNYMAELHQLYPQYDLVNNKGYGSETHKQALLTSGVTSEHRLYYRPIQEILNNKI